MFLSTGPIRDRFIKLTLLCVKAPTKAGTANPGMVAAMLVMPIRTPGQINIR